MQVTDTRFFGSVDYDESSVLYFSSGLPGFEDQTRFLPLSRPDSNPIVFLQSLCRSDLCFLTLPVLAVDQEYKLAANSEDLVSLDLPADRQPSIGTDILCLAILTLAEGKSPTANLMSPIAVNLRNRKAMQLIQTEGNYSHQHPLETGMREL